MDELLGKTVTVIDEEGNEISMKILFRTDNEERDLTYVFLYTDDDPDTVIPMKYKTSEAEEKGMVALEPVEDDEEYEECEEIYNTFVEDPKMDYIKE